jgi:OOP family OmpA-OmpF porin
MKPLSGNRKAEAERSEKMNTHFRGVVLALALVVSLAGCAGQQKFPPESFTPVLLDPATTSRKVDTFIVVLDTASSMEATYRNRLEAESAYALIDRLNRMIPQSDYRAGLLAFDAGRCMSCEDALVLYGPEPYHRDEFAARLAGYSAAGKAERLIPLGGANAASRYILQGNPGRIALIVVSDSENILHGRAYRTVQKLSAKLGDRLCIYPILMDRDRDARTVMDLIVNIGGCGFAVNADEIAAPADMARYVKEVFVEPAAALPSARTAEALPDSDGDGVPDHRDKCPNTPRGVDVDAGGCWELSGVYFDSNQTVIRNTGILDEAAAILRADPKITVEVQGHTDSTAAAEYNQRLSEARAGAVRAYLIQKGIAPERLRAAGFGATRPAASNDTAEGRARNRRVELYPDVNP